MREPCMKCDKKFTPTSWTVDNFWRKICPSCIIKLLDKVVPDRAKIKEA